MAKTLNIIESAYRATVEEQDDTIVWITHALKGAGLDVDVLLRGNAVNYALRGEEMPPLAFGARRQKHGPDLPGDMQKLGEKGAKIFFVAEDAAVRGLEASDMIGGVEPVALSEVPRLFERYQRIWHW